MGEPLLKKVYHVSDEDYPSVDGNMNFFFSLGALFCMLVVGIAAEKIGRMRVIQLGDFLALVLYYFYTVESLHLLYVTRFLSGVVSAISIVISQMYIKEIMPKRLVSAGGMIIYTCFAFFMTLDFSLGMILTEDQLAKYWRVIMILPLPVTVLRIVGLFFICSETPKFYLRKFQDLNHASTLSLKVLKKYFERADCEKILLVEIACLEEEKRNSPGYMAMFSGEYFN